MHIQVRHAANPTDFKQYTTQRLREDFLMEKLFVPDQLHCLYTHYDRMIVGGVKPVGQTNKLHSYEELKADYFLERSIEGFNKVGVRELYPHMILPLLENGIKMGRDKVLEIMVRNGLCWRRRRFRPRTTFSEGYLPLYPDLAKDLVPDGPEQLWVSDITYLKVASNSMIPANSARLSGAAVDSATIFTIGRFNPGLQLTVPGTRRTRTRSAAALSPSTTRTVYCCFFWRRLSLLLVPG